MHFASRKANICSTKDGYAAIALLTRNATMIQGMEHIPDEDRVK